jgi:hypothetical protein
VIVHDNIETASAISPKRASTIAEMRNRRLLEPIGNVPPVELELAYHRQQCESALAA